MASIIQVEYGNTDDYHVAQRLGEALLYFFAGLLSSSRNRLLQKGVSASGKLGWQRSVHHDRHYQSGACSKDNQDAG